MTYTRACLVGITSKERARWYRTAVNNHDRLRYMMSEVIQAYGVEHPLTDRIDDALAVAEELCQNLSPQKPRKTQSG